MANINIFQRLWQSPRAEVSLTALQMPENSSLAETYRAQALAHTFPADIIPEMASCIQQMLFKAVRRDTEEEMAFFLRSNNPEFPDLEIVPGNEINKLWCPWTT